VWGLARGGGCGVTVIEQGLGMQRWFGRSVGRGVRRIASYITRHTPPLHTCVRVRTWLARAPAGPTVPHSARSAQMRPAAPRFRGRWRRGQQHHHHQHHRRHAVCVSVCCRFKRRGALGIKCTLDGSIDRRVNLHHHRWTCLRRELPPWLRRRRDGSRGCCRY
jgi:hypothetical protein